jgi:hypothetical protein
LGVDPKRNPLLDLNWDSRSIQTPKAACEVAFGSGESPLRASLDELVHQQAQVGQDEAANVESEELGRVADAEFEADVRLRRVLEPWVFDLTGDLICVQEKDRLAMSVSEEQAI